MKMMHCILASTLFLGLALPAQAQFSGNLSAQDPADVLRILIPTFQNCGPTQNYTLLGQMVFQAVAMQTNGAGCYPQLQVLGPLQDLEELSSVELPAGPVKTYRATHANGTIYWQIGISRFTQKVEWLTVNAVRPQDPPVVKNDEIKVPDAGKKGSGDTKGGCVTFPEMCR